MAAPKARAMFDESEHAEPQTTRMMSPKMQWLLAVCFWIPTSVWFGFLCKVDFEQGTVAYYAMLTIPIALFAVFVLPGAAGLIGYMPPASAWIGLVLQWAVPFLFWKLDLILPYLIGLVGLSTFPMFLFQSIHCAEMTNMPDIGYLAWVLCCPPCLGSINAGLYYWNTQGGFFNWHLDKKWVSVIRIVLFSFLTLLKEFLPGLLGEIMGKREFKPNSEEFRTYKLNDVQYIRMSHIRGANFLATFSFLYILESMVCPIEGSL